MDLAELDETFARLGLPSADEQAAARGARIVRGRWRVVEEIEPRRSQFTTYASEDALCRALLVDVLTLHPGPAAPGTLLGRSGGPVHAELTGEAGGPFGPRWSLPLAPGSWVVARGSGVVVIRNTAALREYGIDGALLLTVLDVRFGRERWSRAVRAPGGVVGVAGPVLLQWEDGALRALALEDGAERWCVPWPACPRLVAAGGERAVLADAAVAETSRAAGGRSPFPVLGVDLRDGRTAWSSRVCEPAAEPDRVPRHLLRAKVADGRLRATTVALLDGAERTVADVPCPPDYAETELRVVADALDDDGPGLVLLRGRGPRAAGVAGTPAGDLALRAGGDAADVLDERPVVAGEHVSSGVDGEHVLRIARARLGSTRLLAVASGERWSRPGPLRLLARLPGLCVVDELQARGPRWLGRQPIRVVSAIADDGSVRWQRRGFAVVRRQDEVWLLDDGALIALAAADGTERWSAPAPGANTATWQTPDGLAGFREADGHVLWAEDGTLRAFT